MGAGAPTGTLHGRPVPEKNPTDLIVLATEGGDGLPGWIRPSTAERLARRSGTLTLFVPKGGAGFVSPTEGSVSLRRILVPVDHSPDPNRALAYATRAARLAAQPGVQITALHVGDGSLPTLDLPDLPDCTFEVVRESGEVVEEIGRAAREREVGLIVMATEGHNGILDALRGSVTERVLRRCERPLLAVPLD